MNSLPANAPCPVCRVPINQFLKIFIAEPGVDRELQDERLRAADAAAARAQAEQTIAEARSMEARADTARQAAEARAIAAEEMRADAELRVANAEAFAVDVVRRIEAAKEEALRQAASEVTAMRAEVENALEDAENRVADAQAVAVDVVRWEKLRQAEALRQAAAEVAAMRAEVEQARGEPEKFRANLDAKRVAATNVVARAFDQATAAGIAVQTMQAQVECQGTAFQAAASSAGAASGAVPAGSVVDIAVTAQTSAAESVTLHGAGAPSGAEPSVGAAAAGRKRTWRDVEGDEQLATACWTRFQQAWQEQEALLVVVED